MNWRRRSRINEPESGSHLALLRPPANPLRLASASCLRIPSGLGRTRRPELCVRAMAACHWQRGAAGETGSMLRDGTR